MEKKYTPMIQQYLEVKNKYQDMILFYRLGDFYEMFFDDAKIASRELDLVLTARSAGCEKIAMCGVPYHAANNYIPKLVERGYKVAIVEQLEEAGATKGIVKRDVVKIITPGTAMDYQQDSKANTYLASLELDAKGYALIFCEMSTGEQRAYRLDRSLVALRKELIINPTKEIIIDDNLDSLTLKMLNELPNLTITTHSEHVFAMNYFDLTININNDAGLINAFEKLISYLEKTQCKEIHHLKAVEIINDNDYLKMDIPTRANLELVTPLRFNQKNSTLFAFMDHCESAMGSRKLKRWIEYPLINEEAINKRLAIIEYLNNNFLIKAEVQSSLKEIYDLERLSAKVAYGSVNPKELQRLRKTLAQTPNLLLAFKDAPTSEFSKINDGQHLYDLLESALVEEPPINVKDGNVFKAGYSKELDELRLLGEQGEHWIIALEQQERERTNIKNLKVGYNRVFGYYLEVSKANQHLIKDEFGYIRKQTLANAERYITEELKIKEEQVLSAQDKIIRLEQQLFDELVAQLKKDLTLIHQISEMLAVMDAYYALAQVASQSGYVRPKFVSEAIIDIKDGRHPLLDKTMKDSLVANDCYFNEAQNVLLLTGPNMGGKSTYMRQIALIIIMAQIGSYVPCEYAELMLFKQIFTRIGASDDIMSGKSTFMVEMSEANHALQEADKESLILFDEIGRGTSTYDGMALAWSMLEYIDQRLKAKTIFSTHYHELTSLDNNESIKNISVAVHEENDHVTFLYKIVDGKADKSYGVNVAKLAKLPTKVISRAEEILFNLEQGYHLDSKEQQMVVVKENPYEWLVEAIEQLDINDITPRQALEILYDYKKQIK